MVHDIDAPAKEASDLQDEHPSVKIAKEVQHPSQRSSTLGLVLLCWFLPLLRLGRKRPLLEDDVWDLPDYVRPGPSYTAFMELFKTRSSLLRVLVAMYGSRFSVVLAVDMLIGCISVAMPLAVWQLVRILESEESPGIGMLAAGGIPTVGICIALGVSGQYRVTNWLGLQVIMMLRYVIFAKALGLNATERLKVPAAEVGSLLSVDTERVWHCMNFGHWVVVQFFCTFGILCLLVIQVGWCALGGIVVMTLLLFTQFRVAKFSAPRRRKMQQRTSERTALLTQVLNNIKGIKFNALETHLFERLCELRRAEEKQARWVVFIRAFTTSTSYVAPLLASMAVFVAMVLVDEEVTTPKVIGVLAGVNSLRPFLSALPLSLAFCAECWVSLSRIQHFLFRGGKPYCYEEQSCDATEPGLIEVDAEFQWPEGREHVLNESCNGERTSRLLEGTMLRSLEVKLKVKPGELVAIVGPVGSGKSSLCQALLGMMPQVSGTMNVFGRTSYAPQKAWIMSGTVQENVTIGNTKGHQNYKAALSCAELHQDLSQWPVGDQTEIGGRGINLSGGQQARVGLARAVCVDPDIMILDDVLSAVDVEVASRIAAAIQQKKGITRMLCLNSHYHLLAHADLIIAMDAGKLETYQAYSDFESTSQVAARLTAEDETTGSCIRPTDVPAWIARHFAQEQHATASVSEKQTEGNSCEMKAAGKLFLPEERNYGLLHRSMYQRYFGSRHGMTFMALVLACMLFTESCRVTTDVCLSLWLKEGQRTGSWFFMYIAVCAATVALAYCRSMLFMYLAHKSSGRLHVEALQKLLGASIPLFFDVTPVGRILNRFTKDQDVMDTLLPHYLLESLTEVCFLASLLIFCAVTTPLVLVALLPAVLVLLQIRLTYARSSRELQRMEGITRSPIFAFCQEVVEGLPVIRCHRLGMHCLENMEKLLMVHGKHFLHLQMCVPWVIISVDWTTAVLVFFSAMSAVLLSDIFDKVILGLSLNFAMQFLGKTQMSVRVTAEAENYLTSVERLGHFLEIPQELTDGVAPAPDWPAAGEVSFTSICLRYRPNLPLVIQDLTFKISPGEKVGFVGRTGAGKSSVVLALFRLLEGEGSGKILIDNVDIQRVPLRLLRHRLSIIPQDSLVWQGTVRENIDPLQVFSDASLWKALEYLDMDAIVRHWAAGLGTEIKDDNVSGGQKQLLSMCRVLLKRARVVVLDEATASLDTACDHQAQHALAACTEGMTTLTVAHRLQTLADYDRVLILSPASSAIPVQEVWRKASL